MENSIEKIANHNSLGDVIRSIESTQCITRAPFRPHDEPRKMTISEMFHQWNNDEDKCGLFRQYRNITVSNSFLLEWKKFVDGEIDQIGMYVSGGGYYGLNWGVYRSYKEEIFVYYYRDDDVVVVIDGIIQNSNVNFIPSSIELIENDFYNIDEGSNAVGRY